MAGGGGWFRVGFWPGQGAGLEPVRVAGAGSGQAVRPSWSFVGIVSAGAAGLEGRAGGAGAAASLAPPRASSPGPGPVLQGAGRAALPGDCRDVLPSETHVLLLRESALEAWRVAAGPALHPRPAWRRELRRPQEEPGRPAALAPAELPLVPGGYVVPRPDFLRPLSPALRARRLALGHEHAVLLAAAGDLFTWGAGRHGQLGHGGLEPAAEPRLLEALQGLPMRQVAAGGWHSASVGEAGDLYLWGWNESGQLGLPSKGVPGSPVGARAEADRSSSGTPSRGPPEQQESPQAAFIALQAFPALLDMPQGAEVSKVSCGSRHTAALTGTGDLYTWGWGKYGQLGHGATAAADRPKKVCCFETWGLGVGDVVCGPWTTFALALPPL